jgi:hypothetical protein
MAYQPGQRYGLRRFAGDPGLEGQPLPSGVDHQPEFPATSTWGKRAGKGAAGSAASPAAAKAYKGDRSITSPATTVRAKGPSSSEISRVLKHATVNGLPSPTKAWEGKKQSGWNDTVFGSPRAHFDAGHQAGSIDAMHGPSLPGVWPRPQGLKVSGVGQGLKGY